MREFIGLCTLILGMMVAGSVAFGATPNPACVKGARDVKRDCAKACIEDFQIDKDSCRDVDHVCAEACRTQFDACRQPLQDCVDGCNTQVRDNIQGNCPSAADPGRDACVDNYQVQGFVCRDNCRETIAPQVKACKSARKDCVTSCPPPPAPTPVM